MKLIDLDLYNYRNYQSQRLELSDGINVLVGRNAQGKTNALEAVYCAALSRSHRTSVDSELIRWDEPAARMRLTFERQEARNVLEFRWFRDSGRRRQILYNSKPITVKRLLGLVNVVLFAPEDLALVKGSPSLRRRFLDMELSQVDAAYFQALSSYARLVTQRNALLRRIKDEGGSHEQLAPWDEQLSALAAQIVVRRREAVEALSKLAERRHSQLTGGAESLRLAYELHGAAAGPPPVDLAAWYGRRLRERRELDIVRGHTSVGPHRDDLGFAVNGADLRAYGSQGQQRTAVLSLKLSEIEFFLQQTGEAPVLLLDDVMSELDAERRAQLLAFVQHERMQAMITTTDDAPRFTGTTFTVSAGTIARVDVKRNDPQKSGG